MHPINRWYLAFADAILAPKRCEQVLTREPQWPQVERRKPDQKIDFFTSSEQVEFDQKR
jgi:hypothetical protein